MNTNRDPVVAHSENDCLFDRYNLETFIKTFAYPYSEDPESTFMSREDKPMRTANPQSFAACTGARGVILNAFFDGYGGLEEN